MSDSTISLILPAVTAIAAIVAPVVSTYITIRHQRKMLEAKLLASRRLEVIEGYLKLASRNAFETGVKSEFAQYQSLIFLYAPPEMYDDIERLNKMAEESSYSDFSDETASMLATVAQGLRAVNTVDLSPSTRKIKP